MNVTGVYQGIADIYQEGNVSVNGTMGIQLNTNPAINTAVNFFILAVLFTSMVSIGCTMEVYKIKNHLLNPKGAAIAMVAQFGIMPLTAFSIAKILKVGSNKGLDCAHMWLLSRRELIKHFFPGHEWRYEPQHSNDHLLEHRCPWYDASSALYLLPRLR
ncbi:hypothetical protein Q5P01_020390 [Channa striata]|uniref:Uncharacterized protein n=1 Tax=Channa striata TaxID=64152 RepID=A0AA88LXI1_CHASR|nr:hypothetical protein Q5P01_020390 [Channa striata]